MQRQRQRQRQRQGQISCSPVTSLTGGPSTAPEKLEAKTECVAERDIWEMIENVQCLLPVRLRKTRQVQFPVATRQHLWPKRTFTHGTNRTLLTPKASVAVDTKKARTFDHAMDDNDEPWAIETDRRTGWNQTFKSGTYHMVFRKELIFEIFRSTFYQWPSQRVCLLRCVNFSLGRKRRYRIDVVASTVERKTGVLAYSGACPDGCKGSYSQRFERAFHQVDVQDLLYCAEGRTSSTTTRPSFMFSSTHGS